MFEPDFYQFISELLMFPPTNRSLPKAALNDQFLTHILTMFVEEWKNK